MAHTSQRKVIQTACALGVILVTLALFYTAKVFITPTEDAAISAAEQIIAWEAALHMQLEQDLQVWLMKAPLSKVMVWYYVWAPILMSALLAVFVFVTGSGNSKPMLRWFIWLHIFALLAYAFVPSAPPRLVSATAVIDLVAVVRGAWPYAGLTNEYAAMPSLQVAYAIYWWVAVRRCTSSRGAHGIAGLHLLLTVISVLVTGNAFLLSIAAAPVVVAVSGLMAYFVSKFRSVR